jgi:hypothetical protein
MAENQRAEPLFLSANPVDSDHPYAGCRSCNRVHDMGGVAPVCLEVERIPGFPVNLIGFFRATPGGKTAQ